MFTTLTKYWIIQNLATTIIKIKNYFENLKAEPNINIMKAF